MSKQIFVIAGAGPGIGAGVAKRFAREYDIALLSRSLDTSAAAKQAVEAEGSNAYPFQVDVTSQESVAQAFKEIKQKAKISGGMYNVGGTFQRSPFLELDPEGLRSNLNANIMGGVYFSQQLLRDLNPQVGKYPPTLIFTGATASVKANSGTSVFAVAKHGLRALSLSLAKEFGPQGIHVAHAIIDGVVDTPKSKTYPGFDTPDSKISPDSIAETYWNLHTQQRSGFTWEVDIRPYVEKF